MINFDFQKGLAVICQPFYFNNSHNTELLFNFNLKNKHFHVIILVKNFS